MTRIARRLFVEGRVQGVCFRDWAVDTAREMGIEGWIRNRRDGRVEALAAGEAEAVEAFIARCKEGPSAARVTGMRVEEVSPEEAGPGFERRGSV